MKTGKTTLFFLGVGLLVAGLSVFLQVHSETLQISVTPTQATTSVAAMGSGSSFKIPGIPVRLIIPAIGVDAKVQKVGMSWSGTNMGVPTNFTDVGWYKLGTVPGAPGSAVIDGHLDGKYVPKAVFYNLGNLKPGDAVEIVDASGTIFRFLVVRLATYGANASTSEIFSTDATSAHLNLITCAGDWNPQKKLYNKRIVVFTELTTN